MLKYNYLTKARPGSALSLKTASQQILQSQQSLKSLSILKSPREEMVAEQSSQITGLNSNLNEKGKAPDKEGHEKKSSNLNNFFAYPRSEAAQRVQPSSRSFFENIGRPSLTQLNSELSGLSGQARQGPLKAAHATHDKAIRLTNSAISKGLQYRSHLSPHNSSDLHSQPTLTMGGAAQQLQGESNSNDDVDIEPEEQEEETKVTQKPQISNKHVSIKQQVTLAMKTRNSKDLNASKQVAKALPIEDGEGDSKLQLVLTRLQNSSDDEFSQLGTILSERNEVRTQLQNVNDKPIPSPTRGRNCNQNNNLNKEGARFGFNFRMDDELEDGNVMEQTLGRTLTHQKKILQDINSQTSKRQRDYQSPIEMLLSSQLKDRLGQVPMQAQNRRLDKQNLLDVQNSYQSSEDVRGEAKTAKYLSSSREQHHQVVKSNHLNQDEMDEHKDQFDDDNTYDQNEETQAADFSDFDDGKALDEALGASNQNSQHFRKQSMLSAGKTGNRRLTAVIPHHSGQTKSSFIVPSNSTKPMSNTAEVAAHAVDREKRTVPSKDQVSMKKPQSELVMRLANLSMLTGQFFAGPAFRQLTLVDLRNNRLVDLPGEICQLTKLTQLKVDYNYLAALPFSLGNLTELQYLSASQNKLLELPDSLFRHDSKLTSLLINDNKISKLQRSLGAMKHLKQLYLHSNMIVELPTSFYQLNKLVEFSLDWLAYIEKTQEELEEMQGLKQPTQEEDHKEHLQTINEAPVSARKYFDSNVNETQGDALEQTQQLRQTIVESLDKTLDRTHRNSSMAAVVKEAQKPETFSLSILSNKKVLKGDKGLFVVKELRLLCKLVDNAQKNLPVSRSSLSEHGKLHFIQFIMYFQNLYKLSHVKDFVYRYKQRTFLHQMGLNGHIYLFQASIAVLGMKRSLTSFNINKTDEENSTTLVVALRQKKFDFVKYLLRLPHISTTIYSHKYGLPLHIALQQSEFKLALKLLKRQDQLSQNKAPEESVELDVNVPNEQGNTALHLVFMNFNQNPEVATLVAKILIKKGANLRAKNKNGLGLLHAAVQCGTVKALKFAVEHNQQYRRRHHKYLTQAKTEERRESGLFQFNMKAGSNRWTLLHYAISATNLQLITFLLDCKETINLNARDNQGRRAIDLCPFSSPIFKSIRAQIHRRTQAAISETKEDQAVQVETQTDYSVPVHIRCEKETKREVINQLQVFNSDVAAVSPNQSHKKGLAEVELVQKIMSSRECLISIAGQRRLAAQLKPINPRPESETIMNAFNVFNGKHQNFESVPSQTSIDEPYHSFLRQNSYLGLQVITDDSRQRRQLQDFHSYPATNAAYTQAQFLSTSNLESSGEKCFDLYNSQAAAYPFVLIDKQNETRRLQFDTSANIDLPLILETATFIQNQPLNMSCELKNQDLQDEEEKEQSDEDEQIKQILADDLKDSVEGNRSQEGINVDESENGENVDDDNDHLGSKAYEARVSQWNRKQSTEYQEEKKIQALKLRLAQNIVDAFEDVKVKRAADTESAGESSHKKKRCELAVIPEVLVHASVNGDNESSSSSFDSEEIPAKQVGRKSRILCPRQVPDMLLAECADTGLRGYEIYMTAFRLSQTALANQLIHLRQNSLQLCLPILTLAIHDLDCLILLRANEEQEQKTKQLIVINSTGRLSRTKNFNHLQRTKSQSSLQFQSSNSSSYNYNFQNNVGPMLQYGQRRGPQHSLFKSMLIVDPNSVVAEEGKLAQQDVQFRQFQQKPQPEDESIFMFESNNNQQNRLVSKRNDISLKSNHRRNLSDFHSRLSDPQL